MKKFLSIALAVIMIAAMAITVSAGTFATEDAPEVAFSIKKANTAWVADGVFSDGEYYVVDVQKSWLTWACNDDDNDEAAKNLDFTLAMSWDDANIYAYIQFEDANGHDCVWTADEASNMWYSGAVQVSISGVDEVGDQRLEYGISKNNDGAFISTVWADYLDTGYAVPESDYTVVINGNTVTYEIRTPMSAFLSNAIGEGEQFGVNYVISWGNDQDYIHTQLAAGCTGGAGKAADLFAKVTLEAAPVVEVVEEATDVVVEPAAQTADLAVVAIIALGAVAVAKKH